MSTQHHDVVIVGGGNAGLSLAGRLRRDGARDVVVVEPERVHHYRPMLSYVAGGQARLADLQRPQDRVTPSGVQRVTDRVVRVDAGSRLVHLAGGGTLHYNDLALCPGSSVDWAAVPGAREAVETPHAATSYLPDQAVRTWEMLAGLTAGRAVFVMDDRAVPCAPVALKPLFLALAHWRRTGVREEIDVELLVAGTALAGLDRADRVLRETAAAQGVRVRFGVVLAAVDSAARTLALTDTAGDAVEPVGYDALYLAPPHRAPDWIAGSGLAGPDGFLRVDTATLQHPDHPRIWGLGDVAALDTLPSGGALRAQVPVVAANIAARRRGGEPQRYDGYTVAPVTTGRHRLLLAEHDRAGRPRPSVPVVDLVRPRRALWVFDRYLEPIVYFRRLLQGKV